MADGKQPPLIVEVLFWLFSAQFLRGRSASLHEPFGHFLPEATFAIIALVIMAELLVALIGGIVARLPGIA